MIRLSCGDSCGSEGNRLNICILLWKGVDRRCWTFTSATKRLCLPEPSRDPSRQQYRNALSRPQHCTAPLSPQRSLRLTAPYYALELTVPQYSQEPTVPLRSLTPTAPECHAQYLPQRTGRSALCGLPAAGEGPCGRSLEGGRKEAGP